MLCYVLCTLQIITSYLKAEVKAPLNSNDRVLHKKITPNSF